MSADIVCPECNGRARAKHLKVKCQDCGVEIPTEEFK